ncbi:MAG: hypothetical protein ABIP94_11735 [Planctomycetota bacterium]
MSGASSLRFLLALMLATALGAICVRLAWLGDDAYITLRSVENWVSGNGLRWNAMDRVQINTHPLWMMVLATGRWFSGEVYFTTIAIGLAASWVAIMWLLLRAGSIPAMVATAVLLASARAFGEYATSGLEPPLTYLLLVAFVAVLGGNDEPKRRFVRAATLATLIVLNRIDLALLVAPAVFSTLRGVPRRTVLKGGLLAASPGLAWLAFAGFFYGSPLPVVAHAKAFGAGIPAMEVAAQGLYYVWHTAVDDPVLFAVTIGGLALGLAERRSRWFAIGGLLYLGYVVKVGGDFMEGRFFLPPFVVAIAVLGPRLARARPRTAWVVVAVAIVLLATRGVPAWLRSPSSETQPTMAEIEAEHGIVDERRMHYGQLGLLAPGRSIPRFGALEEFAWPEGRRQRWFLLNGSVGTAGFGAGLRGHLVDPILCDPLLARLPARDPTRWRIGHVLRRIPEGYYETLASGENRLRHAGLRRYYEALRTLTQGPLFGRERLETLARMAVGAFDSDLRTFVDEEYFTPPRVPVSIGALPAELPLGVYWFDEPQLQLAYEGGLEVHLASPQNARSLRVQAMGMCQFRFRFVQEGVARGEAMGAPLPPPAHLGGLRAVAGLRVEMVAVPETVGDYDTLWIDVVETSNSDKATGPAAIGAVTFGG